MPQNEIKTPSFSMRRLKALIKKEFFQIIRDPSTILISIVLPTLLLFLYAFGVSLDIDHLRIGLVMEDTAPDAQSLAKSFADSTYFDVKIGRDRREFLEEITAGHIRGIVVIPSYFSQFRDRPNQKAPIQVITDGSEPNTANFVKNYSAGAFQDWLQQESLSSDLQGLPLVTLQPRFWYNEELESSFYLIPGSLAITMTLIGTLLTALVIAREWERGTMETLLAMPVSVIEILLGKFIPYFILGMISMTLSVLLSIFIFGVPFRGSFLVLAVITAFFLFAALGQGLLISTLSKNQFVASQMASISGFLPSFFLSGVLFEIASMPTPIQYLTYIIPARYFVTNILSIFLVGTVWKLIIFNVIPMLIVGMIFFTITFKKTVKRLD